MIPSCKQQTRTKFEAILHNTQYEKHKSSRVQYNFTTLDTTKDQITPEKNFDQAATKHDSIVYTTHMNYNFNTILNWIVACNFEQFQYKN